jgi:hypothetical protein
MISIKKWSAVGCALTLGTSVLTMGAALASDASADTAAARALGGGSTMSVPAGGGTNLEVIALGACDAGADRAAANVREAASDALGSPTGSTARAAEPSGPLGAGDGSSEAFVARAGPARALGAGDQTIVRASGVRRP